MMPRAAATAKRGAHVACTVAALHDGMPVAVAERRRHERGAEDVRNRLSCAAVVMRGTSGAVPAGEDWAWTTWPRMSCAWALERCTAPFRALLGPLVVPLLHAIVEEASR